MYRFSCFLTGQYRPSIFGGERLLRWCCPFPKRLHDPGRACLPAPRPLFDDVEVLVNVFRSTCASTSPWRASGSRWSKINAGALWLCPSIHWNCASSPCRAALKKFIFASSKVIRCAMSPYACGNAAIRPAKNAALATSSTTVGPDGNARFSIRRCGTPSVTP